MSIKKIAAAYARYSSDLQKKTSIDDQLRNCNKLALDNGYEVSYTYKDEGISGTSINRIDYQQMLKDAENGKFNVLIVDDLSRLNRNVGNGMVDLDHLHFYGVQVLSVSEGYDSHTSGPMRNLLPIMKGIMDENYIHDLAHKTKRGQEGQFARGFSTGGSVYGYRTIPIYDNAHSSKKSICGFKHHIVEEEADVIRLIFKLYTEGFTPRQIAQELNNKAIPSPSGKEWSFSTIQPNLKKNSGLLLQPMYNGQRIWNRTHSLKNPKTGKRKQVINPVTDWSFDSDEELRIIDKELWAKVQNRIRKVDEQSQKQRDGIKKSAGRRPGGSILSGLLKCPKCGSNLIISGRNHFACSAAKNKGVCDNNVHLKKTPIEEQVLDFVYKQISQTENLEVFKKEVERQLKQRSESNDYENLKKKLEVNREQINRLVRSVRDGMKYEFVKDEMEELESQKMQIEKELVLRKEESEIASSKSQTINFEKELKETIQSLADYKQEMPKSKELLSKLLNGNIIVREIKKASEYEASFEIDPTNLISNPSCQEMLVAGAGFEPTTFGL